VPDRVARLRRVTLRAVLIVVIGVAIIGMLWLELRLGPVKIVALTQPPVVDCSGKLEAAQCAEVLRQVVEFNVQEYGYSDPQPTSSSNRSSPGKPAAVKPSNYSDSPSVPSE